MRRFRFGAQDGPGSSLFACILAVVMLLSAVPSAWALEACFTASVGPWRGPVLNGPGLQVLDAEFQLGPDDTLVGSYHVHDLMPFDGSLTGFHQTGRCEADFTWTDRYGTGTVHIRFEPELGRFLGYWGAAEPEPNRIFNGYRVSPDIVS